jgi:hypothetical protein
MLGFAGVLVESLGIKAPGVAATFGTHAEKKMHVLMILLLDCFTDY